ncbi:MAG: flagellar assembly peptidoglycan hydrolase FlgJ [Rhodoferax sp.]|nr:flagellar assembly peptidoglycan hydrolase FlgJ [Rhodoferax sp.]
MGPGRLSSTPDALAADARTLGQLKARAGDQDPGAVQEAARQFESLFMRELLKSMREATMKSGLMDSPGTDLGTDLLDQQFAVQMSGRPGGLSDLIARQLTRQMGGSEAPAGTAATRPAASLPAPAQTIAPTGNAATPPPPAGTTQSRFVQRHSEAAERVARDSGIPASYMIGQAGHETGWGRQEIRQKDGSPSFNLFGIKAGAGWTGKVAEVTTTEYVNGVPRKTVARFRAYDSYEASFKDYARLINESPRYARAREQTGSVTAFATGLQRAGYATDPDYASKLSRAINATLRLQRAQA